MSFLTSIGLKFLVPVIRLLQPCPISPYPDDVIQIPSRDTNRTLKAHVYKPAAPTTPCPVLLNFHGSGFILPWHGSDEVFCRRISQETKYTVLDIQYRLAPEHPFPAAIHDVADAVKYVLSRPDEYEATHISLSGFSAGANLIAAVFSSPDLPANVIHSVLSFYAPSDLSIDPSEKKQPDPSVADVVPAAARRLFYSCYIGKHDKTDPMVSPGFMDVTKLPDKALFITCAHDTLAPETEAFAEKITERRGPGGRKYVASKRIEGVGHAWDKSCKAGSEEERKRDEVYVMAVNILNAE